MAKTVVQYLKSKGISSFAAAASIMMGKKVKLAVIIPGYGIKGDIITITSWSSPSNDFIETRGCNGLINSSNTGQYATLSNLLMVDTENIPGLQEEIKSNKEKIAALQDENVSLEVKIKFMQENGLEKFDDDEFKVYAVLQELDSKKSTKLQKAQAIARLIKG